MRKPTDTLAAPEVCLRLYMPLWEHPPPIASPHPLLSPPHHSLPSPSLLTEDSKHDPAILWQSFKAARIRRENDIAHERLCAYLHEWVGQRAGLALPLMPEQVDRFRLLHSSIA